MNTVGWEWLGWAAEPCSLESEDTYSVRGGPARRWRTYHVVIVEEAQGCDTVIVPVDSHHGLRGSCQGVFQVGLPGLVLTSVGKLLEVDRVIPE